MTATLETPPETIVSDSNIDSRSAGRYARRASRDRTISSGDLLMVLLGVSILALVSMFLYNGVKQLQSVQHGQNQFNENQRQLHTQRILRQFDVNGNGILEDNEARFAYLNTYQL